MILFSHGFGVQKDDRGLFTDIAPVLKDEYRMFDYNNWDDSKRMLTVAPIDAQVETLKSELAKLNEPIDMICHSQGCLIAALACSSNVRTTILLAPATTTTSEKFAKLFTNRPESVFDRHGDSILQRSDGSQTLVPESYWNSLDAVGDVHGHYGKLAEHTSLHIVTAGADEILGKADFSALADRVALYSIKAADHNFTGDARYLVIKQVASIL